MKHAKHMPAAYFYPAAAPCSAHLHSSALSHTFCSTSRLLCCSPSGSTTTSALILPPAVTDAMHLKRWRAAVGAGGRSRSVGHHASRQPGSRSSGQKQRLCSETAQAASSGQQAASAHPPLQVEGRHSFVGDDEGSRAGDVLAQQLPLVEQPPPDVDGVGAVPQVDFHDLHGGCCCCCCCCGCCGRGLGDGRHLQRASGSALGRGTDGVGGWWSGAGCGAGPGRQGRLKALFTVNPGCAAPYLHRAAACGRCPARGGGGGGGGAAKCRAAAAADCPPAASHYWHRPRCCVVAAGRASGRDSLHVVGRQVQAGRFQGNMVWGNSRIRSSELQAPQFCRFRAGKAELERPGRPVRNISFAPLLPLAIASRPNSLP